ncbi:hypothetical protein GQ53DRAFT_97745 [Thozetella sp. PMI_491]|nr:hypothetical protein GQ53DRAFT_97745 [Thozetella sp. PMI_491]
MRPSSCCTSPSSACLGFRLISPRWHVSTAIGDPKRPGLFAGLVVLFLFLPDSAFGGGLVSALNAKRAWWCGRCASVARTGQQVLSCLPAVFRCPGTQLSQFNPGVRVFLFLVWVCSVRESVLMVEGGSDQGQQPT